MSVMCRDVARRRYGWNEGDPEVHPRALFEGHVDLLPAVKDGRAAKMARAANSNSITLL